MAKVLITGGSGSIGRLLIPQLVERGHTVHVIGRTKHEDLGVLSFTWNLEEGTLDERALSEITHIIHLAGAGIADRPWSPSRKKEIIESRVKPLHVLDYFLKRRNQHIQAVISASAIGYYGAVTSDEIFTESATAARDFLGKTCRAWENAVLPLTEMADREVRVRTGVVLMKSQGALAKLMKPTRLGLGAAVGTGKQWMPWIHIDDLLGIYIKAVEDTHMQGAFNAVAPMHVTQSQLIKQLANTIGTFQFLPAVPGFVLNIIMGDMAAMLTEGSRVSSSKIRNAGFEFKYTELRKALQHLIV